MFGELSLEHIDLLLQNERIGRLGCYYQGKVYILPINYVYEQGCIYGHSLSGMKIEMMRLNPQVCFQVDHITSLSYWESVMAWGRFEELTGDAAAYGEWLLGNELVTAIASGQVPHQFVPSTRIEPQSQANPILVYRIQLEEKIGRFETPAE
jgi:nitroimidazol reductase NimA-like FMN-containing flavoprotein (pyridoxamine 5'-phosphate oxidase superfamily)